MVKLTSIIIADIKELWQIKIFRVRIFFAIVPTIAAAVFGFLAADNTHPFDYIAEGSYIKPPTGRPGEQVIVSWSVRQNRSICPGIVTRQLIDVNTKEVVAMYDPVFATRGPVTNNRLNISFAMPKTIPTGWIGYRANLEYTCNWLQQAFPSFAIRYQTPMLLFKVQE